MASLDLYTPIRAMPHGLSKEGGGGSPLLVPVPLPQYHGTSFSLAPSLPCDLWVSIKNRLHSPFSLPSQQAVKQAGNQASKQANGIVVSHFFFFLFLISFQSKSLSLTFSGEFKSDDGSPLFERSRLSIGCLNVYLNAVKDGLAKRKIHPLLGIKLMSRITRIQGT